MRTLPLLVVALALLVGCSSTESGWTKPGMTEEQLGRDRMDCMAEARQVVPSAEGPKMRVDYPRFQKCMAARGYTAAPSAGY
jgi:hypothetical protein